MSDNLFSRNVVAILWDFDNTLIPGSMQTPLFKHFGVQEEDFWNEVKGLGPYYEGQDILVDQDTAYLNHILTYVKEKKFEGLDNALLQELGAGIEFHSGLPDFFKDLKVEIEQNSAFKKFDITVEHYIISTGLRRMIMGSMIHDFVDGVWGCDFVEEPALPGYSDGQVGPKPLQRRQKSVVSQIGYSINNTTKTRAVFEINKGANKLKEIQVNAKVPDDQRRVPFKNMLYIADGPSDIPVFSLVNHFGGHTFAVYKPNSEEGYSQAYDLERNGRVNSIAAADYSKGSAAWMWIRHTAKNIAQQIVREKKTLLRQVVQQPPTHIPEIPAEDTAKPSQPGLPLGPVEVTDPKRAKRARSTVKRDASRDSA